MRKSSLKFLVLTFILSLSFTAQAQEIEVQLGPDEVGLNEVFYIKVTIKNANLKNYSDFPQIDGFAKRGTNSSSSSSNINGRMTREQSIIQVYMPLEEGSFTIPAFTMEVNGKTLSSPGKTVKITPPVEKRQDTFDSFFNRRRGRNRPSKPAEFVDVKEDAFLALTTDKDEVYVGEGFTVLFAFYVADANRAPLQFHEPGKQLSNVLKELRPESCWEEDFKIENIYGERVNVGGKTYTRYKIYQASYYPLNLETVNFPSVPFEMIKYRVAKSPSYFGRDRQEDFKTFYSKEKSVKVKALPPHPLKDAVAVGVFELDEKIDKLTLETGESFTYDFNIYGEGNIAGISSPVIPVDKQIDFYPPNSVQDVNRGNGRVTGSKKYSYYGIPNEPGKYDMKDYFSWIYFNPETAKYDTLRSEIQIEVTGESKTNANLSSTDLGSFYDGIETESNDLMRLREDKTPMVLANVLIIAMLAGAGFMFFKK